MFNEAWLQQLLIASESRINHDKIHKPKKGIKDHSLALSSGIWFIVEELLHKNFTEDVLNERIIREKIQQVWNEKWNNFSEYMKRWEGLKIAIILFLAQDEYIDQALFQWKIDKRSMTKYQKKVFFQKIANVFGLWKGASPEMLLVKLWVWINEVTNIKMGITFQKLWTPYLR